MTESDIIRALRRRHPLDKGWVFATKVGTSTGATPDNRGGLGGMRQIDAFAMAIWPSLNYQRVAYEIKVSWSDFLKELREPMKKAQAYYLSDKFFFVVAPGVASEEDFRGKWALLNDCGLLEIQSDGSIKTILGSSFRHEAWPMPIDFMAAFLMRVAKEALCRG